MEGPTNGETRIAYVLGVPLADNVVRQWPQMGEIVKSRELIGSVEGTFEELTLAVGARYQLGSVLVVEWSCDYGDGAVFRTVTIAEVEGGEAVVVTDYWGKPFETPQWRQTATDRLDMPPTGRWPSRENLTDR